VIELAVTSVVAVADVTQMPLLVGSGRVISERL